jgi:transcriptional regulator with XRE-family HTH domain
MSTKEANKQMGLGQTLVESRKQRNKTQSDMAKDLPFSQSAIAKFENGSRNITKENRSIVALSYDDPAVYFAAEEEATGGVTLPFLNGKHIERSLAAMKELAQHEAQEALNRLNEMHMYKPAQYWTDEEKAEMKQSMNELLDAAASIQNLVAISCKEYQFSQREIYKNWRKTVKQRGWME